VLSVVDLTRQITYLGTPGGLRLLVRELEQRGVQVRWDPPEERRNQAGDAQEDYVELDVTGPAEAMQTAIDRIRDEDPDADVRLEDADDAGFQNDASRRRDR
jgi:hypothetical protein